jgi:cytochrome c peroxidase
MRFAPLVVLLATACPAPVEPVAQAPAPVAAPVVAAPDVQLTALFKPLPADMATDTRPIDAARVELGRVLYFDPRLSKNHDVSCNSCHMLDKYGVDGKPTSPGHKGQLGGRNSPTVYNAALHTAQFWDGRAVDVEEQAKGPVLNPVEMAMPSEAAVVAVLRSIPGYAPLFETAFPEAAEPITYDNMAVAIGAFERTLVTPSAWDRYLAGDGAALTEAEVAGAKRFVSTGCVTCHMGATLGGTQYQRLGLVVPYETEDVGRKAVTGSDADLHVFKVPSLRNIARTGPYFHDGKVDSLPKAVRLMGKHQLGKDLTDGEVQEIATFLEALTGELPDGISEPTLPESGPKTHKPDPT